MQIEKLPLAARLERMKTGLSPYPEIADAAVRAMAHIPIAVYLKGYDDELSQLPSLIKVPAYKMAQMTYEEVATAIYLRRLNDGSTQTVSKATQILAAPLIKHFLSKGASEKA